MNDPLDDMLEHGFNESSSINTSLRGWSEGDVEFPLPVTITDADLDLAARHRQNLPPIIPGKETKQLKEFPLYYGPGSKENIRRKEQNKYAKYLSHNNAPLILMTYDFKVFSAKNIWSLLWLYLLVKLRFVKTSSSQ